MREKHKAKKETDESRQLVFESLNWTIRYDWVKKLLKNVGSFSAQYFDCMLPEKGKFKKNSVSVTIDSKGRSVFVLHVMIEPDAAETNVRRLSLGVSMPQSDVCVSNYILKGTKEEVDAYLYNDFSDDAMVDRLQTLLKKLTDRVDC